MAQHKPGKQYPHYYDQDGNEAVTDVPRWVFSEAIGLNEEPWGDIPSAKCSAHGETIEKYHWSFMIIELGNKRFFFESAHCFHHWLGDETFTVMVGSRAGFEETHVPVVDKCGQRNAR